MLIGCGPHAKRIYLPKLRHLYNGGAVELRVVVDVEAQRKAVSAALALHFGNHMPHMHLTRPFTSPTTLPKNLALSLDMLVKKHAINAVIISTAPLAHMQYALWAARKGLHILMDKPISARRNSAFSVVQATALYNDYKRLCATVRPHKAFVINAERRYHPGFEYAFGLLEEVAKKFGIPVTAMQSSFGDGLWRLPEEVLQQDYRSYKVGHGIISHSGYHILDVMGQVMLRSFVAAKKNFDSVGVYGTFTRPLGLLQQQSRHDYIQAFGQKYAQKAALSDEQLALKYAQEKLGEVDVSSLITLFRNNEPIMTATMNLLHNGFSRRAWVTPNQDLYKGNGRVQHEYHNIVQGPYQTIHIHSYQANDRHDTCSAKDYELGGNNHFDVHVFRNSGVIGGKPLTILRAQDIASAHKLVDNQLLSDQIKVRALEEFLRIAADELPVQASRSWLGSHTFGIQLMSMLYTAGIRRQEVVRSQPFTDLTSFLK